MTQVKVTIPATTANLGPGFDCLGLALGLYNEVTLVTADKGLSISIDGEGSGRLPTDSRNLVARAAEKVFRFLGKQPPGLRIHQNNQIPVGSGLGSSAAATLGGIVGAAVIAGETLSLDETLRLATELEGHPDNVAPAIYGGLTLVIKRQRGFHVECISVPAMKVTIILPDARLSTASARAALPKAVPFSDAVFNVGRMGLLIRGLVLGDYEKLGIAMDDRLHQPYRLGLIPGANGAVGAARAAGAAAVVLSGAGPSIAAFAPDNHRQIAEAAKIAFREAGIESRSWTLPVDSKGCFLRRDSGAVEYLQRN